MENRDLSLINEISDHNVKFVDLEQLKVAYLEKGQGETVLLLHGFPDLASTFDETITFLGQRGYRVIAPFLPGYFPSGFTKNGRYSPFLVSEIIKEFSEKMGIQKFTLVGHDWGAAIAYTFANRYPESLQGLVALSIPPARLLRPSLHTLKAFLRARHFFLFQFGSYARWYSTRNNFAYLDYLVDHWAPSGDKSKMKLHVLKKTFLLPGRLDAAVSYYESLRHESGNREIQKVYGKRIEVPSMVIAGEEDLLDLAFYERLSEGFKAPVEFVPVYGAGHFIQNEKPDILNEALLKFLTRD